MSLAQVLGERFRTGAPEPIGVIDIGSNSVRLVVYEAPSHSAAPLFNEKVLCGLGRTLATTGRLGEEATDNAIRALTRFREAAKRLNVKRLKVLATSAARDATDGPDFIKRAEEACGWPITVVTGEEEAELAANGIRMGFVQPDGLAGDLGGGSLELIDLYSDQLNNAATLPLGGLRLMAQTDGDLTKAQQIIDKALAKAPWMEAGHGRDFFAVGGTWRSLAKLHMEQNNYPLRIMHGYTVPVAEMIDFCSQVAGSKKITALNGIHVVSRARRDILPIGALILERVLTKISPSQVVFSMTGIREGLVYSLLSDEEKSRDPLLGFCYDLAKQRSRSVEHSVELCTWTDALFDGDGPHETPDEKRLRHAACLLSDIGWRGHPDYRGEQTLNLVAHSGLTGIDHPGRMFVALALYHRHDRTENLNSGELPARLRDAVNKRGQKRAKIVGAAVRAAHMLSIGTAGMINHCPIAHDGNKLVLTIANAFKDLDGERVRRRFSFLAELLDKTLEVRFAK